MPVLSSQYRILIVEDDPGIRRVLSDALTVSGYEILQAADGTEGMNLALTQNYDLALLDIVLPGEHNGLHILKAITREHPGTPVIMLTAKGSEDDRVRGLTGGADDYLVKPFSIRELLARIEAVLRRSPDRPVVQADIPLPGGMLRVEDHTLVRDSGEEVLLSGREFELLHYFVTHPDRIISRETLLRRVWDLDPRAVETRSVEMTLTRLREKLGEKMSLCLYTQRGQGYRWNSQPS